MSSDRPSDVPSSTPEATPSRAGAAGAQSVGQVTAATVRARGVPLLEALEAHLPGTRRHADSTAAYAFAVAAELELDRAGCELIRETARLHDIGMVYVPQVMLAKPSDQLDPSERAQVGAHLEHGYRLARGAGVPDEVCGWILRTRERWDGAGPEGLVAGAVPLESQIIRVACAGDLLLGAGDRDAATATLRAAIGNELRPAVAMAMIAVIGRVVAH